MERIRIHTDPRARWHWKVGLFMKPFRWTMWQTIKHQFFDSLMLIGMRDRLRCPECRAVGTWKPHGGWFESIDNWRTGMRARVKTLGAQYATNRRWLCKYCGYNLSTTGQFQC